MELAEYLNQILEPSHETRLLHGLQQRIRIVAKDWNVDILSALKDFRTISELAHDKINLGSKDVKFQPAPHKQPRSLPRGKMAIYGFWFNGEWLKIGRAGPNSKARYTSHHYNINSAGSTLAKSIKGEPLVSEISDFDKDKLSAWIKCETSRVNILLSSEKNKNLLSLLEAFLHVRLNPRYEG